MMKVKNIALNYLLVGLFILTAVSDSTAQNNDDKKVSFSGIVYDSGALKTPLGQVSISFGNKLGSSSNTIGEFNMNVRARDTLTFSHIGFYPIRITIPDSIRVGSVVAKLFLVSDTVNLEQVYVSSLRDFNEFKNRFLNMDVQTNKELTNAQNNIKLSMHEARTTTESTTEDKLEASLQYEANKTIYYGQTPPEHMVNFVSVAAGLISLLPTKKEGDSFYKEFVNARNQNNMVYIKPRTE